MLNLSARRGFQAREPSNRSIVHGVFNVAKRRKKDENVKYFTGQILNGGAVFECSHFNHALDSE